MTDRPDDLPASPIEWDETGAPRSRRFGDIYFSRQDGLAESRAVYLQGCGLPQAWRGRSRFVVGELGFGTGLNIAALLDLWRREGEPGAWLHIFSVEAYPLSGEEAARALAAWPELADAAQALTAGWPGAGRGFHRVDLPGWNATLDVAVMEAAEALHAWDGQADAWFLDGFAPSANPEMWREEVLAGVARCSAPSARLATFTVAGAVRRGLQAQGFTVARQLGHGRKRERLEAWREDAALRSDRLTPRVAIVGAGIAGAALSRAFVALGVTPLLIERERPGAGASGNPAALVTPRLDAGGGPPAQLFAQAFTRAVQLYANAPGAVIATGALQLEGSERDLRRFDKAAASDLFGAGEVRRLASAEAWSRLGEDGEGGGVWFEQALTVKPGAVLEHWLEGADRSQAAACSIQAGAAGWDILDREGNLLGTADVVCVAAGPDTAALAGVDLQPVRGQASFAAWPDEVIPVSWGGYMTPTQDGILFGATQDRDETDLEVRAEDHRRNLASLAGRFPRLAAELSTVSLAGRASIRAVTPDRGPLAGEVAGRKGLYVLSGLGGRGFTLAPLLGEHIAAKAVGAPSPLPLPVQALVDPQRFVGRRRRRGW